MTAITSVNSAALIILQQIGRPAARQEDGANSLLRTSNGIAGEPSAPSKQASASAGRMALDRASGDSGGGKIVIDGVGEAGSIQELIRLVQEDDSLTESERQEKLDLIDEVAKMIESVQEFKSSSNYKQIVSGELAAQLYATSGPAPDMSEIYKSIDKLSAAHGRTTRFYREF